ncbi:3'-5' RNA helicase YTHDC2-like isoform X2 [Macrosteles quadrilineatus]|uniref:3'-5' RNA helicase YTHDC2-like isoform X2 n=1 Tax=Macrosteles quadrilineatus TaxID=74068 RepID=UPI0023E312E0|nr:3'-5' RNA helicase YTHDC2-like isoform X2 [Macrosteles quadrilineatus]
MSKLYSNESKSNFSLVPEEVKNVIDLTLKRFVSNPNAKEHEYPSSFESCERAYVHAKAKELGLKSKSRGKGLTRAVTVYKREESTIIQADALISLARSARQSALSLVTSFPVGPKERQELLPITERDRSFPPDTSVREAFKNQTRLNNGIPSVPPTPAASELQQSRKSLPIWQTKDQLIQSISTHSVVIVVGETGCGKSTQVPQYILEHAEKTGRGCRVICSMPRRISAVAISERVAAERGEPVGSVVGYQVHTDCRLSPHTALMYTTYTMLLRTLLIGDSLLATVTHVIIDEIHERDRVSDYMLIVLRDALAKYRGLKLILMSATLDVNMFTKYFTNCPVISGNACPIITVPGRLYEVQEFFLEDILKKTGYMTKDMAVMKKLLEKVREKKTDMEAWTASMAGVAQQGVSLTATPILGQNNVEQVGQEKTELDGFVKQELERCLGVAWASGSEQAFSQLLQLIVSENISVDYQHSETGVTALMAAAARGSLDTAELLLALGARVTVRAFSCDSSALDLALSNNHQDIVDLLTSYMIFNEQEPLKSDIEAELPEDSKLLVETYERCCVEDHVDVDLIVHILHNIHESGKKGAVLIFLPAYEQILTVREKILADEKKFNEHGKVVVFILHSKIQAQDQKKIFQPVPTGQRKVVLSTSMAETSLTIDDLVFVIDSGKVREKRYNAAANMYMTRCEWVSMTTVRQRRGRAGRTQPGVCFHLFSSTRYRTLAPAPTPAILREPLQELCLNTKLLAPPNSPIADFLARAIEPPSPMVTRNAVQLLKTMDALDAWEDLTDLGRYLLEMPISPHYGKMLIFSVLLKCLDPVLTITCILAQGEIFKVPTKPGSKRSLAAERKKLAENTFSDHMLYLRLFQGWQQSRWNNSEKIFCERLCVDSGRLELVTAYRAEVLSCLRALGLVKNRGNGDIRDVNSNSENWAVVKAALTGGLYPNLARVDRDHNVLRTQKEHKVVVEPWSTLREPCKSARTSVADTHTAIVCGLPTDWLIYEDLCKVGRLSMVQTATVVTPVTVAIFAGPTRLPPDAVEDSEHPSLASTICDSDSENETEVVPEGCSAMMKLDDWLVFRSDNEAAALTYQLKQRWNLLLLKRLKYPNKPWTQTDDAVVNTIVSILSAEEQTAGLEQPQGVGQRPRPLMVDCHPHNSMFRRHPFVYMMEDYENNRDVRDNGEDNNTFLSNIENQGARFINQQHRFSDSGPGRNNQDMDSNTKYFMIKAGHMKSIEASVNRGLWAFTHYTEKKIVDALKAGKTVILVFSLQHTQHFQGYAKLRGDKYEAADSFPEQGAGLNVVLPVEWIKQGNISHNNARHICSYNDNKLQNIRDGQELDPSVGEALCKLWETPMPPWPMHMNHQNGFPGRPIRGRPHYNPHYYRK